MDMPILNKRVGSRSQRVKSFIISAGDVICAPSFEGDRAEPHLFRVYSRRMRTAALLHPFPREFNCPLDRLYGARSKHFARLA